MKSAEAISENGSSGNPQLSTELIARVSTYLPLFKSEDEITTDSPNILYSDLHNLCLATGPEISRSIKQSCLKKNLNYIGECQNLFGPIGAVWVKEGHLAWMSVNKNWRDYVTDDVVEQCRYTDSHPRYLLPQDSIDRTKHPLSGLANPARAIQLGLIDALRFLVEDKLIDVNAKHWTTYYWRQDPVHLLTVAINSNQPEAFDYLLSLEAIDFNGDSTGYDRNYNRYIFGSALEAYVEDEKKCHFFCALVQHPRFDPNRRMIYGYNPDQRVVCKMTLLHMFVSQYAIMIRDMTGLVVVEEKEKRFLNAFQLVLDAGADPKLGFDNLRSSYAIAFVNLMVAPARLLQPHQEMIEMMSKRSASIVLKERGGIWFK